MNRRLTCFVLGVLASGAISCAGAAGLKPNTGSGGTDGIVPIPVRPCSNGTCPDGTACFANQCIARATYVGDMAIEIDPPSGSGSQITERPAAGLLTSVQEAYSELSLA